MSAAAIQLELKAEPDHLAMGNLADFKVSLSATNQGDTVIDPGLGRTELRVNDEPSKAFSLAVGNGKREAGWFSLASGETVSMTWSTLGPSLFPAPGTYSLTLRLGSISTPPTVVHVEP